MRFANNLYAYLWKGRGNNCHSYLFSNVLRGKRPHVLIDPGHVVNEMSEKCLEKLTSAMLRDDIAPGEIGLIINTHSHPDHCEANLALAQMNSESGAGGGQALIAIGKIEDEYRRTIAEKMSRMLGLTVEFEPDFYLQEGELNLGRGDEKLNLQIIHTPGHSPGSICIYSPENKVLITGDVVFNGSVGRTDLPGGDSRTLKQSIEKLSELDVEYLLPGHSTNYGDIIRGKNNVVQNFASIRMNYFRLF
ncbi:MBL fold metallo-hydrolase [Dehalococcoidia bacterium]|nr:MBL fold metallo-hydrolase [Dehalococcoidia bacterium]MCL0050250.1 MBL fold metallo-hydrolase [Dehalococcoidia bacterium]